MPGYSTLGSSGSGSVSQDQSGCLTGSPYAYRKWCGVRRSTWLLWMYIITYVTYLVLGGWAMGRIEEDKTTLLKEQMYEKKSLFLEKFGHINRTELEELLELSQKYRGLGISGLDKDRYVNNWSFGDGILFTVTIVTTIGYGHVYPITSAGKIFCIIYAIIGIPFTLVFLTATVQRFLDPTCHILAFFFARMGERISPFGIRVIHLMFMSTMFLLFFILIPSIIFYAMEPDWTFLDGFYFVFISLTTIGLGDYIPGDHSQHSPYKEIYKSAVAVYLLLGLIFMTLTATVFYDIPQLNLGTVLHQHKDIHLPSDDVGERSNLTESVKKVLTKSLRRAQQQSDSGTS